MRTHRILILLLSMSIATASIVTAGCAKFDLRKNIPWGAGEDGEFEIPIKMIPCWTDTILQTPNAPSMRGFGGRLMFYARSSEAIKVEGSLVVYAFDETNRQPNNNTPDRKFVFTEEQFKQHHSKSERGHSYSFWIPWDLAGGERREISLIARFTPKNGGAVVSEQTKHLLPGTAPLMDNTQVKTRVDAGQPAITQEPMPVSAQGVVTPRGPSATASAVEPAAYQEPIVGQEGGAPGDSQRRRMETTTISLPQRFGMPGPFADAIVTQPGSLTTTWYGEPNAKTVASSVGSPAQVSALAVANGAAQGAAAAMPGQQLSNSPTGQPNLLEPLAPSARFAPLTPRAPIRPISRQPLDRDSSQLPPAESQFAPLSSPHTEPAIQDASRGSLRPATWR